MNSSAAEPFTCAIDAGITLRLALPEGAAPLPDAALPFVDVSTLPGARVPLRLGFAGAGGVELHAVCAAAPSDRWAPGVEELVLGRATAIAEGALGEVERFEAREIARAGPRFEQRFEAFARRGGEPRRAIGKHVLGFAGEAREALLCTAACSEPRGGDRCAPLVESAQVEGAFSSAPPPSLLVRGVLLAAEHPGPAAVIVGAATIAAIALVLARRPRPRP